MRCTLMVMVGLGSAVGCAPERTTNVYQSVAPLPALAGVYPTAGPPTGGQTLSLVGAGFLPGATVAVGGVAATVVQVLSDSTATLVTPAHANGTVTVSLVNPDGRGAVLDGAYTYQPNAAPAIVSDAPAFADLVSGDEFRCRLTVTDPEGGPVNVRCLNPPVGLHFTTPTRGATPLVVGVRWLVGRAEIGPAHVVFEVVDPGGRTARLTIRGQVTGPGLAVPSGALVQDVSGDGIMDLVVPASQADIGATVNAGAIHVWVGGASPTTFPTATATVTGALLGDQLGRLSDPAQPAVFPGCFVADVTGDGTLDVIAAASEADVASVVDAGAIHVFAGGTGLTGGATPTATCTVSGARTGDRLGATTTHAGIQCVDVTGDGIADLVVAAPLADVGASPVANAGAVYVFAGGSGLTGAVTPRATLRRPSPVAFDAFGGGTVGQAVACRDVTGDGVRDVVVCAPLADVGTTVDAGEVLVWRGGTTLTGTPTPLATLQLATPATADQLGRVAQGDPMRFADVTGDNVVDLLVASTTANLAAVDSGGIVVWRGGATLSGTPTAAATLAVTQASLGLPDASGQAYEVADVTGDGVADVLAGVPGASGGRGAVYVWAGGTALTGAPSPTRTLTVPGGSVGDVLGRTNGGRGLRVGDLTGDGVPDLVVAASYADAGATDTGALYVWAGGQGFGAGLGPTAACAVPGAPANQTLPTDTGGGEPMQFCDVTGDGVLDLVASSHLAGGVNSPGAVFVWGGGIGLSGSVSPTATLAVSGVALDQISRAGTQGTVLADVTGDGLPDVLVGAEFADVAATNDGAIYLWAGGSGLAGAPAATATLSVSGAANADFLGASTVAPVLRCTDLTGDGIADVVSVAFNADAGGSNRGAAYVWPGGSGLTGSAGAPRTFVRSSPVNNDLFGLAGRSAFVLGDFTGDGVADLMVGGDQCTVGATGSAGLVMLAPGGTGFGTGVTELTVPSPVAGDQLGR